MLSHLFLQASHYYILPNRREKLNPRARFVQYQEDLHRIAGEQLDPHSLAMGDQYTYAELADAILNQVGTEILPRLDVLVTSYWTPEFDPEFSAFGPYLHHKWSLKCQSFDVTDQGSIAPVLALSVLKDYLTADGRASEGLLLGIEQSTVPQAMKAYVPVPQQSSAGVVRVSQHQESARAEILTASYLSEAQILTPTFRLQRLIANLCETFQCSPETLTLMIRRNTYLCRAFQYWSEVEPAPRCRLGFLPAQHSCMNLFYWLTQLVANPSEPRGDYLFVDEDVESLAAAAVLVRKF